MKFEYIILLILAFNVIAAVLKKRKADAASKPGRGHEAAERLNHAPPRAEAKPVDSRQEVTRDARTAQYRAERVENRDGQDLEAAHAPAKKGLGRDLLEQLAKELGMETNEPERPRPASPYRSEAVPEVVAVVPASTTRAPRKITAPVASVAPASPMRRAPAVELRSVEALRRAVIAKEVLGPPLSRGRSAR